MRTATALCSLISLFGSIPGYSGTRHLPLSSETIASLDKDLTESVCQPGPISHFVERLPTMDDGGLTYFFNIWTSLPGVRTTSVDEAEVLFCILFQHYIGQIRAVRTLRPWLDRFPIDPDTCEFYVRFDDEYGSSPPRPYIVSVALEDGVLKFSRAAEDKNGSSGPCEIFCTRNARSVAGLKELYQPICPRTKAFPVPKIPLFSSNQWKYESPLAKEEIKALETLCSQTSLNPTIVGAVGKTYFDLRPISFALHGSQLLELEKARDLAKTCLKQMFEYAQNSSIYKEHVKTATPPCSARCYCPSRVPSPEQISFRISFWDENIDRPASPYIAEIRLLDGKLSYFTADDNQQLVLVFEEAVNEHVIDSPFQR